MALYKLTRDWKGFAEGAVIECVSSDRIEAMLGVDPPGILYVEPEPEQDDKPKKKKSKAQTQNASSLQDGGAAIPS